MTLDDNKAATFGEKIDVILGLLGNEPSLDAFQSGNIAKAIGYASEAFSRTKKKVKLPDTSRLGLLLQHLGIADLVDYSIFYCRTAEEMRLKLKEAGVGSAGGGALSKLSLLLNSHISQEGKLELLRVLDTRGLTTEPIDDKVLMVYAGSKMRIRAKLDKGLHLVLLSEKINRHMTVLRPSHISPETKTHASSVLVPDAAENPSLNGFMVAPDYGLYRLYALWCEESIGQLLAASAIILQKGHMSSDSITELVNLLQSNRPALRAVNSLDYQVI